MSDAKKQPRWLWAVALAGLLLLLLAAVALPPVRDLVLPPVPEGATGSSAATGDHGLPLDRPGLVGWVEDAETGARVEGLTVHLRQGGALRTVQTDAQGEFKAADLAPGAWTLKVVGEGYLPDWEPARVDVGQRLVRGVEVLAWPVGTLRGAVTAHGRPVVGASLSLLRQRAQGEPRVEALEVTTDARGRFEAQVRAGSLRLQAQTQSLPAQASAGARLVGGGQLDLRLDLTPRGSLRVSVVNARGEPVPRARVEVLGAPGGQRLARDSDADGQALLEGVAAGEVRLRVWAARHSSRETAPTQVTAGQEASLEVVLPPLRTVMGQVVNAQGRAVGGATVRLYPEGQPGSVSSATSGRAGEFRFQDLEQGRYQVQAFHPRYGPSLERRADTRGEELLKLELRRGGAIEGEVVLSGGGSPEAFTVVVESFEPEEQGLQAQEPGQRGAVRPLRVNGGGAFALEDLAPGRYGLHVDVPDHGYGVADNIRVSAGGRTTGVSIRIEGGALLSGRVVDAATRDPVEGAQVVIRDQDRREKMLGALSARTDANGDFFFEGVAPGRRSLAISKAGYTSRIVAGVKLSDHRDEDRVITLHRLGQGDKPKVEFFGIGASLQKTRSGAVKIARVLEGGPASGNGLRPGDEILSINGDSASEMELGRAVDLIRGEEGSDLALRIRRPGEDEPREINLQRGRVVFENHPHGGRGGQAPKKNAGEQ